MFIGVCQTIDKSNPFVHWKGFCDVFQWGCDVWHIYQYAVLCDRCLWGEKWLGLQASQRHNTSVTYMHRRGYFVSFRESVFFPPKKKNETAFVVKLYKKSRNQPSWQHTSQPLWLSKATFVWMSPSMTRVGDLIACCCCRYTLSDDSMGEQVRSQPIVTNRSKINGGTRNYVETLTLLFTKLHLEPYQSQTEVCLQQAWLREDYQSKKEERGKQAIL